MIKLFKGPEPDVLRTNSTAWTKAMTDKEAAGIKPTEAELGRYNHPEIKTALLAETHDKCAYCESKFRHVAPGDIEHIVPKKLAARLRFEWDNLTIACDVCNTNKGVKEGLVDPFNGDPQEYFVFYGPMVLPIPGNSVGTVTERALGLNRPDLLDRRAERLRRLHDIVLLAMSMPNEADREVILEDLKRNEVVPAKEYTAIALSYVESLSAAGHLG